jgi:CheY-like chemotaxis protein
LTHSKTILIIEDNHMFLDAVSGALSEEGYQVLTALEGESGICLALEHIPDLILCDIHMPGMSGYDVLHALRKNEKTDAIVILLMTAAPCTITIQEKAGINPEQIVVKPMRLSDLVKIVQRWLA